MLPLREGIRDVIRTWAGLVGSREHCPAHSSSLLPLLQCEAELWGELHPSSQWVAAPHQTWDWRGTGLGIIPLQRLARTGIKYKDKRKKV